jgi:glycosyltransferase involved in cell wall biosynthesis
MNKPTLLLCLSGFARGGIEKAALNLVRNLQKDFEVTIFSYYGGPLLQEFPRDIKMILAGPRFADFGNSMAEAKKDGLFAYLRRGIKAVRSKKVGNQALLAKACHGYRFPGHYDVAISYVHGGEPSLLSVAGTMQFVLECVDAKAKVQFIHDDLKRPEFRREELGDLYSRFDRVYVFSEGAKERAESFIRCPVLVTSNFFDVFSAQKLKDGKGLSAPFDPSRVNLVVLARFSPEKGLPRLLKAIGETSSQIKKPFSLRLYGSGIEETQCRDIVASAHLEGSVFFMGETDSPLEVLSQSDLLIVPSLNEAHPVVIDEAHLVGKNVLATDYASAKSQLLPNDIVVPNSEEGLREGLVSFINGFERQKTNVDLVPFIHQNNALSEGYFKEWTALL